MCVGVDVHVEFNETYLVYVFILQQKAYEHINLQFH